MSKLLGFLKEMWAFPNNFLLCTQPEEEEEETSAEQEEEELNEDDLPRVQNEVDDLQQQFDASVWDKHSLAMELESMKERLKTATDIIDRLVEAKREIHSDISFVFSFIYLFVYLCYCILVCQSIFAYSNHHPFAPKLYLFLFFFCLHSVLLVKFCSVAFLLYILMLVTDLFV